MSDTVELLRALIRNECVNDGTPDSGREARSVETLSGFLGAGGTVVEPHPGRSSIVYRLPAADAAAPTLMLLGHLDVVPVTEAGWSRDPFGAEIVDGVLWGRGAIDMLTQTAAMAAAFRAIRAGEVPPPPGGLVFAAVADEEAGGVLGTDALIRSHPGLVACDYLITEIAAPHLAGPGGPVLPVTVAEKGPAWRRVGAAGVPGHASQPYGTANALTSVADAVTRLAAAEAPATISPEWRDFVAGLDLAPDLAADLVDPDRLDAAVEALAVDDPGFARWVHACTHLTVAPTVFRAGTKANVIPDHAQADLDVRLVPGQEQATVDDHFRKVLGPDLFERVEVEPVLEFDPSTSPASGPLWDALAGAAAALTGSGDLLPTLIPVTTDARFFRARGVVAYGVGLLDDRFSFTETLAMFHGHDERIGVDSVEMTRSLYERTIGRFGELTR